MRRVALTFTFLLLAARLPAEFDTDPDNSGLAAYIQSRGADFAGAAGADGKISFTEAGSLPGLDGVPEISEGDNQCVGASFARAIGYLVHSNDPRKADGFDAQKYADGFHSDYLHAKVTHSQRGKAEKPPKTVPLPACAGPPAPEGGEDAVVQEGAAGGGAASGESAEGSVPNWTSFKKLKSSKHDALTKLDRANGTTWATDIETTILKRWGADPESWPDFFRDLAQALREGAAIEVEVVTGEGQNDEKAGNHMALLGKVLDFGGGRFGILLVDDSVQGNGIASNYFRGPFIFDASGKCIAPVQAQAKLRIDRVFKEAWKKTRR